MAKIFLDLEKLKRPNSGLGQFCMHLSRSLLAQTEHGFIGVYLPKALYPEYQQVEKIEWKSIHKLTKVAVKTTIWHSFHQEAVYFPKDKNIKRVLTIHDLNFLDQYQGRKREKMLQRLQKHVQQSDAVAYISNYTKEVAEKYLKIPKNCITEVIYNGVAIALEQTAVRPAWIKDDSPFLFTIGIVGEKKNFHVLVEMMQHLPELKLYICGKKTTAYADKISKLIHEFGLGERIFLCGEIDESEKIWLYKNCAAFVFPSKNEGFGLPVVEAMNFGKPLVLAPLTSLPEIGGEVASYFESFDANKMAEIVKMTINNHDLIKRRTLMESAKRFDWNIAAKEYIKIYKKLL
ncbi:MAG: glycosyltransferase family 4 protein [Flavobacteriales bacterium]|jgi:glycosyltransferase involved in cell wall biosynthesis|nr:glycosyltransferase family 4 protein [Flavobacteriales bacterium]